MLNFFLKYKYLFFIIFLAGFIRLFQIGQVPPSPDWDEAALGWNAYSILKTGRDEYGTFFPLSLRSFDDYKPPLYMYLTVPFVAIFGLDTWVIRLPSAILGTSVVLAVFFLTKELLRFQKKESGDSIVPYLVSLLLAISPWHIQFSRIAFEANVGLSLTIWASTLFFCGLRMPKLLPISAFLFSMTLYAYHSQRIFTPFLCLILFLTFRKKIILQRKIFITAIIVGIITLLPLIPVFTDKTTLTRLRGTSALADQTRLLERSARKLQRDTINHSIVGAVFDNRRVVFVQKLIEGYVSHYSLRWLFVSGDNERHHSPSMGLMYLWELPFFLLGIFLVAKRKGPLATVVLGWFIIAPIAASPTTELPHGIRTLVFLPTLQIFVALGLISCFLFIRKKTFKFQRLGIYLTCLFIILCNIIFYFDSYYRHLNHEYSPFWQYGYKQAVDYASNHHDKYKKIVVSTKLEQPHMFFLFFLKYDPVKYLKEGGTASGGFEEVKNRFDIYEFRPIHWDQEVLDGSILYIGKADEIHSKNAKVIYYIDGKEAIKISS